MKKITLFIFIFIFTFIFINKISAQVGIGTNTPNSSAALDISDSTRGLLIPRMTMVKRQAIVNPAQGLLVYQTDNSQGLWSYNGSAWVNLPDAGLSGNAGFTRQASTKSGGVIVVYTSSNANAFTAGVWYPTVLTGTPLGAIALDNFVMVYTTTGAFVFGVSGLGASWSAQPITGTPVGIAAIHDMIMLATTTNLYGFARGSGNFTWYIQPVSGTPLGSITAENTYLFPGYCIAVYTGSFAYALSCTEFGPAQWYPQALSGTPLGGSGTGSQAVVYTSTNAYAFDINSTPVPAWFPVSISGTATGIAPE